MMIPVRCFTCGSVIADRYEEYSKRIEAGDDPAKVLDDLGINRYCCRRMLLSQVDVIDEIIQHGKF